MRSRKVHSAAQFLAVGCISLDRKAITKQSRCFRHSSPAKQRANAAGGNDLPALITKRFDLRDAKTMRLARLDQKAWAALAILAEMKVESGDDMADAKM